MNPDKNQWQVGKTAEYVISALRRGYGRSIIRNVVSLGLSEYVAREMLTNEQYDAEMRIVEQLITGYKDEGEEFLQHVEAHMRAGTGGWN